MPDTPPIVERRGLDAAVIALIKQLHEDFISTHANVHETFVEAHTREHELGRETHDKALTLAHAKFENALATVNALLAERDRRYQERHQASQEAIAQAVSSVEARVAAAFEASEKAISVAAIAIEKKADATYVSIGQLQARLGDLLPKGEADQRFIALEASNAELRERVKGMEAIKQGGKEAFTNVQMFLGIVIALITLGGILFAAQAGGG